jgi:hypothetical protein
MPQRNLNHEGADLAAGNAHAGFRQYGRVKLPAVAARCRGTGKGVSEGRMCARPPGMKADAAKGPAMSRGGHGFDLPVVALLMSATAPR